MKETIAEAKGRVCKGLIKNLLVRDHQSIYTVSDLHGIPNGIENFKNVTFLKIDFFEAQNSSLSKYINAVYDLIHQ
jgi:putative NADH-flavin reductase